MDIIRDGRVTPSEIAELRETVGWDRSENNRDQILARHFTHYVVRDTDGLLIAYLSVLSDGVADALLLDLVVHPRHQRKGIGTRLVRGAVTDMKAAGVQCVHVTFDERLEPFYAQCGFHMLKAGIVDFKEMVWNGDGKASGPDPATGNGDG